ncbi:hypothetical protein [Dactylosporangium matsuzakiense]|uniref:Uncharacterized protein n=1 Tax=Dactylosporangium matsuzakiense TaxID=53360 RepID=A0A9W6NRS5_9ACTN|nr:hypothetical protein [Dactylosporangium matsuzakiense]GLL06899.1 hypothetical protein GCM10017581_086490 [Dactylosporangium matsuzakiense]
MHEDQQFELVEDAFATFRAGGPLAVPLGADAARTTVRHRRHVRTVAVGALAAILLMVPVAVYASGIMDGRRGPDVATSIDPDLSPSVEPSSSPLPSPSTSQSSPAAPDGRVTSGQLAHATVDFGPASAGLSLCPTGRFTFTGNPTTNSQSSSRIAITKIVDVDFDHDGALESVALITCAIQGADYVVLALDRTAGGSIVAVGRVVATSEKDAIQTVFDIRVDDGGAVGVQVGDRGTCCGTTEEMVEHQWRSYGFDGSRFQQTAGPTKFTPVPPANDLTVTGGGDLVLGAPSGGARRGSLTVTVHNNGPSTAPGAIIEAYVYAEHGLPAAVDIETDLNDCSKTSFKNDQGVVTMWRLRCHLYPYAVGASRSYTFRFTSPVANDAKISADAAEQFQQLGAGADITEEQPGIRILEDPKSENNEVNGRIKLTA